MQLGEKSNQGNYLVFVDLVQWKKQWQGANRQPGLPFIKKKTILILILIFNIYWDQQVPRRHPDNVITFCSSDNVSGMSAIASDHLSTEIAQLELRCYTRGHIKRNIELFLEDSYFGLLWPDKR